MDSFKLDKNELEKINRLTRREFSEEELYAFPIVMCDNEIDRDGERFSIKSLNALSSLFVGATGIFDHNAKGENQTARVYDAKVITDSTKKTLSGENYTYLLGYVYMVRTDKNKDLIKEIEAGIKKEISVSCAVRKRICSICGKDKTSRECRHKTGRVYSGKICSVILDDAYDAYEFSFVAIPAQPKAGVTKVFGGTEKKSAEALQNDALNRFTKDLRSEAAAALSLAVSAVDKDVLSEICKAMSADELKKLIVKLKRPKRTYSYLDEVLAKQNKKQTTDIYKM